MRTFYLVFALASACQQGTQPKPKPKPATVADPSAGAKVANLRIDGMTCDGCAQGVQGALAGIDGVESASVSIDDGVAVVAYDGTKLTPDALVSAAQSAMKSTGAPFKVSLL